MFAFFNVHAFCLKDVQILNKDLFQSWLCIGFKIGRECPHHQVSVKKIEISVLRFLSDYFMSGTFLFAFIKTEISLK